MKKIYTMIAAAAVIFTANAQNKAVSVRGAEKGKPFVGQLNKSPLAVGDTLMYMPLPGTYVNPTDMAAFNVVIEDIDGLSPTNVGYDPDWGIYYSTDSSLNGVGNPTSTNWYHPWETPAPAGTDSAFYWHATSWFTPAGQANNWLEFGPITLPATGGTIIWYDRTNPAYRDGYKVLATTTPSSPVNFADFSDPAFYTKTDAYPDPTYATDTTWVMRMVNIPASYNGQVIYLAFQHNANDMDCLYLDEITVVEGALGVKETAKGAKLDQNVPNPCSTVSTINFELDKNATVALSVYDVTGKKLMTEELGNQTVGHHSVKLNTASLAAGVYYYSLNVNNVNTQAMKMVVVK